MGSVDEGCECAARSIGECACGRYDDGTTECDEDWLFGDAFAAEFIARTAWPLDSRVKAWSDRLVAEPDLREREFDRARGRLVAAFRSLDTSAPDDPGQIAWSETGAHDDECESEFLTGPMAYTECGCRSRALEPEANQ